MHIILNRRLSSYTVLITENHERPCTMNNRFFGKLGESSAAEYLEQNGFTIIGRNVYVGRCEIDIIAEGHGLLIFAEVKTRRQKPDIKNIYGRPADAVNHSKRTHMTDAVKRYLYENRENVKDFQPRMDIIEVYCDPNSEDYRVLDIKHFPNAVHR